MREWIGRSVLIMAVMIVLGPISAHDVAADSQGSQTVTLDIDGMTCGVCVKEVKAALAKLSGVSAVEITVGKKWLFLSNYADARAVVTFDPGQTRAEVLIKAVESASTALSAYKARVLKE